MAELKQEDALQIPTLVFPSPTQDELTSKLNELTSKLKSTELKSTTDELHENLPHDPQGVILEKNVMGNQSIPVEGNRAGKPYLPAPVYQLPQNTIHRIHSILITRGMDSQQAAQSLKEIVQLING